MRASLKEKSGEAVSAALLFVALSGTAFAGIDDYVFDPVKRHFKVTQ